MREIFDWKIVYEALSGIPFHYGCVVRDSVVMCMMTVEGNRVTLDGSLRIDAEVMAEPHAVLEILRQRGEYGSNAALVAVLHPEVDLNIDGFFTALTSGWPLAYHAGYALQTDSAVAASCACGENMEMGDVLELCGTVTAAEYVGQVVGHDERWFRTRRTPGGGMATKMAALIDAAETDPIQVTALVLESLGKFRLTMAEKARIVRALRNIAFRDGFLSWATSTQEPPADFAEFFTGYERPDQWRLDRAIALLTGLCRWLPQGDAAVPLGCASYLAWFSGNGLRARVLYEQAVEENPEYSLAVLVGKMLGAGAPPPWVTRQAERLVS